MDKSKLIQAIIEALEQRRSVLTEAAQEAHKAATHEESKAENEYDTRGLEASYLAGAQARRVAEIDQLLGAYQTMKPKSFGPDDPIAATALVELDSGEKRELYFVVPASGGVNISLEGRRVLLITPRAPLGMQLMGAKQGGFLEVRTPKGEREYEIISVW